MRRLHPRGAANRGICVDADGAMLGPACVLVRRTARGFRAIERGEAAVLQKCVLGSEREENWLFRQSQRIADALGKGEIALAQIYGLRIPVGALNDRQLKRLANVSLDKAGYDPDEPRIPKGEPHAGEWTSEGGDAGGGADDGGDGGSGGADSASSRPISTDGTAAAPDSGSSGDDGSAASSQQPPMQFKWPSDNSPGGVPPKAQDVSSGPSTLGSPDVDPDPALWPPGSDAINPDSSIEDILLAPLVPGGFVLGTASRSLARALARIGIERPLGFVAHHIVPVIAKAADPARETLERLGIGINDAANGVFLPKAQHSTLHNLNYYTAVNEALARAKSKSKAEQILRAIADGLSVGTFP